MKTTANTKWNNAFLALVFALLYLPIFYLIFLFVQCRRDHEQLHRLHLGTLPSRFLRIRA